MRPVDAYGPEEFVQLVAGWLDGQRDARVWSAAVRCDSGGYVVTVTSYGPDRDSAAREGRGWPIIEDERVEVYWPGPRSVDDVKRSTLNALGLARMKVVLSRQWGVDG